MIEAIQVPEAWLPEPLVGGEVAPHDRQIELASDLPVAFLVRLEQLAPEERAAFLLHDVLDPSYFHVLNDSERPIT